MRTKIKNLFSHTIVLQYSLPHDKIDKSKISTSKDFAFKADSDSDVANLIYNSIVDLAFDDYQIEIDELTEIQKAALEYKIRFNVGDETAKLKLGFYGEALLNVFLQTFFGTDVIVARGEFYDLLSQSEIHGYDCHHIIERDNSLEFWFGESKFYESYTSALNSVWRNINEDIGLNFLEKNLHVIINKNISTDGNLIGNFIKECKNNPYRKFYDDIRKYDGKLTYPILIVSNELNNDYDKTIQTYLNKIDQLNAKNPINIPLNLDVEIFFIFLPVEDAKAIKLEVLKCIQESKPLI